MSYTVERCMFYAIGILFMLTIVTLISLGAHYEADHFDENHRFMRKYFKK